MPVFSSVQHVVDEVARQLTALGCSYALFFADGRGVSMSSNVPPEQVTGMLGIMLEAGEEVRGILTKLFEDKPLWLANPENPEEHVEVPTEEAVAMVLATLLTNLQLKGQKKSMLVSASGGTIPSSLG